jgi:hypothetical protein
MRFLRALAVLTFFSIGWSAWMDAAVGQGVVPSVRPQMGPGVGGGMLMTIEMRYDNKRPQRPEGPVNTLQEMLKAIAGCWSFPPEDDSRQPVDPVFQVSFKRSGELFGKPRVIRFSRDVTPEERGQFYTAVAEAIDRCSPLPFTDSMGGAIAGRTLQIRIIDSRKRKQADTQWLTTKS